jgi:hypothetical protein
MPWAYLALLVSLIFAIIYAWPIWHPTYEPWRNRAFAISWLFMVIFVSLTYRLIKTST